MRRLNGERSGTCLGSFFKEWLINQTAYALSRSLRPRTSSTFVCVRGRGSQAEWIALGFRLDAVYPVTSTLDRTLERFIVMLSLQLTHDQTDIVKSGCFTRLSCAGGVLKQQQTPPVHPQYSVLHSLQLDVQYSQLPPHCARTGPGLRTVSNEKIHRRSIRILEDSGIQNAAASRIDGVRRLRKSVF